MIDFETIVMRVDALYPARFFLIRLFVVGRQHPPFEVDVIYIYIYSFIKHNRQNEIVIQIYSDIILIDVREQLSLNKVTVSKMTDTIRKFNVVPAWSETLVL